MSEKGTHGTSGRNTEDVVELTQFILGWNFGHGTWA